jgi:hypothetical protein
MKNSDVSKEIERMTENRTQYLQVGADIHAGNGGYSEGNKEDYEAFVKVRNKSLVEARIKDLADQAREYATTRHPISNITLSINNDKFEQKFAELLIQECADVAKRFHKNNKEYDAGLAIEQHFGVE